VILTTTSEPTGMRDLAAKHYSRLVHVQGIVIQAGKPTVKATAIMLQCAPNPNTRRVQGVEFAGCRVLSAGCRMQGAGRRV